MPLAGTGGALLGRGPWGRERGVEIGVVWLHHLWSGTKEDALGAPLVCPCFLWEWSTATTCYMESIAHRELRNNSADVLRRVEAGESFQITNRGRLVARLVPVEGSVLSDLLASGNARPALAERSTLTKVLRRKASVSTARIIEDVRGRW